MNQPNITLAIFNILDGVEREVRNEKARADELRERSSGKSSPNPFN